MSSTRNRFELILSQKTIVFTFLLEGHFPIRMMEEKSLESFGVLKTKLLYSTNLEQIFTLFNQPWTNLQKATDPNADVNKLENFKFSPHSPSWFNWCCEEINEIHGINNLTKRRTKPKKRKKSIELNDNIKLKHTGSMILLVSNDVTSTKALNFFGNIISMNAL